MAKKITVIVSLNNVPQKGAKVYIGDSIQNPQETNGAGRIELESDISLVAGIFAELATGEQGMSGPSCLKPGETYHVNITSNPT